jgi:N-dimethylarginine dimethylaminohydrolase
MLRAATTIRDMRFGAESMVAPLREVLVKRPGEAFGRAFDDPAHGFLHAVDLPKAQRQHGDLCGILTELGVVVDELEAETASPDLVYVFDPAVVTKRGAILLRPGKPNRRGEETELEKWLVEHDVPVAGRIEAPGTVEGGDTFWLEPGVFCIGRSLRTNRAGASQLADLVGGEAHVFDLPYHRGPGELVHLLSVISPVAERMAVVFLPLLPVGLYELLREFDFELIPVPEEEFPTLGCNILAVRPGVLVMAEGNPVTRRALKDRGCEVHTFAATEIGINGGGGPTCLTRPILREA